MKNCAYKCQLFEFTVATHIQLSPAIRHLYFIPLYHFRLSSTFSQGTMLTQKPTFLYLVFTKCPQYPRHFAGSTEVQWGARRDTGTIHPFSGLFLFCSSLSVMLRFLREEMSFSFNHATLVFFHHTLVRLFPYRTNLC